jgi:hypothetical protein
LRRLFVVEYRHSRPNETHDAIGNHTRPSRKDQVVEKPTLALRYFRETGERERKGSYGNSIGCIRRPAIFIDLVNCIDGRKTSEEVSFALNTERVRKGDVMAMFSFALECERHGELLIRLCHNDTSRSSDGHGNKLRASTLSYSNPHRHGEFRSSSNNGFLFFLSFLFTSIQSSVS